VTTTSNFCDRICKFESWKLKQVFNSYHRLLTTNTCIYIIKIVLSALLRSTKYFIVCSLLSVNCGKSVHFNYKSLSRLTSSNNRDWEIYRDSLSSSNIGYFYHVGIQSVRTIASYAVQTYLSPSGKWRGYNCYIGSKWTITLQSLVYIPVCICKSHLLL
jgi:hypothetical protein